MQVIRFNAQIKSIKNRAGEGVTVEYYHYDLCNGIDHFHYYMFTLGNGIDDAKKLGACDSQSCKSGRQPVYLMQLPWRAQEVLGFTQPCQKASFLFISDTTLKPGPTSRSLVKVVTSVHLWPGQHIFFQKATRPLF